MMLWFGERYLIIPAAAGTISGRFGCCKCCVTTRGSCDKITSKIRREWEAVTSAGWARQQRLIYQLCMTEPRGRNPRLEQSLGLCLLCLLEPPELPGCCCECPLQLLGLRLLFTGGVWMFPSSQSILWACCKLLPKLGLCPAHISAQTPIIILFLSTSHWCFPK